MNATGATAPPLGRVLDFMRLIWALDHGLQSVSKRMQASLGLTGPQRMALRIVGRSPGISAGDLASVLRLHPSTLTGILARLEGRGFVRRTRDRADGRRARIALTPRGRRLDVPSSGTVESVIGRVLAGVPASRVRSAARLLAAVAAALLEEEGSRRGGAASDRRPRAPAARRPRGARTPRG